MASQRITSAQPRWWAIDPSTFGLSADVAFQDASVEPAKADDRSAAIIQSQVIYDLRQRRVAAGYPTWRAMTEPKVGLGISQTQLAAIVRGEAWIRLHQAAALGRIFGGTLVVAEHEIRALRATNADLEKANKRLRRDNETLQHGKWLLERRLEALEKKVRNDPFK